MARRFTTPNEDEINQFMRTAAASGELGGVDPRAVKRASSNYPKTRARGIGQVAGQIDANRAANKQREEMNRQQAAQQRDVAAQQRETERQGRAMAAEQERQRMVSVRAQAAEGVKTTTDIQTGRRDIQRHPDGAPKFEAGPQGQPFQQTEQRETTIPTGFVSQATQTPNAPAKTTGREVTSYKQAVRDDRGNVSLVAPESKTDPKTGEKIHSSTDPVTGQPVKTVVGIDMAAQERAKRLEQHAQASQALAMRENAVLQSKPLFQAQWGPARDEYQKRQTEFNAATKDKLENRNGTWVKIDSDTGKESYPDAKEVAHMNTKRANAEAFMIHAKAKHDKMLPTAENFNRVQQEIAAEKLRLEAQRLKIEAGLPDDDGGVAESMAARITGAKEPTAPTTETGIPASTIPPGFKREAAAVVDPAATAPPEAPPAPEAIKAFTSLPGATLEPAKTYTAIKRGGKWIGSIERDPDGTEYVTLKDEGRQDADANKIVRDAGTEGTPVFIADNPERPRMAQEEQWTAGVLGAKNDPALIDPATGKPTPLFYDAMRERGAMPKDIAAKVQTGLLSVQRGEAIMREVWGDTLQAPDAADKVNFKKWIGERTAEEHKAAQERFGNPKARAERTFAERWNDTSNLEDRQRVWVEYLGDYLMRNQGKPGVDRAAIQAMMRQPVGATMGTKVASAARAGGRILRDNVAGSMLGIAAGLTTGAGSAEVALFGDEAAKKHFDEWKTMVGRDTANWNEAFYRNLQTGKTFIPLPGTEKGRQTITALDDATAKFQRVIDEEYNKPTQDKERIDAAESLVRQAAMDFHNLNNDPAWPVTEDSLDANKDQSLKAALARYAASGDPQQFELYKERLLMANGRRQQSANLEKKMMGANGFEAAVTGAMYAGWQEIGSEMVSTAVMFGTGFLSKALQVGLKGVGATGKASRIAALSSKMASGLERAGKFGVRPDSLVAPLTKAQRVTNAVKRAGGVVAMSAGLEGVEELIPEGGADSPNNLYAFAVGAFGGMALAPMGYVQQVIGEQEGQAQAKAKFNRENNRFANAYNAAMIDQPDFETITPEQAGVARQFVNEQEFTQAVATMQRSAKVLADPQASPTAKLIAQNLMDGVRPMLANQTDSAVQAAKEISQMTDPQQRIEATAYAKVATGNAVMLTPAERSAVQASVTEEGMPYFAAVAAPDGTMTEQLTDEGIAEITAKIPVLRPLMKTAGSETILTRLQDQAQAAAQQPTSPINATETEAFKLSEEWDRANRSQQSNEWFEGGRVNEEARNGFAEAIENGGENLPTHGMAKAGTLSGAFRQLMELLQNGLDPARGGGRLHYAGMVAAKGAAHTGTTSGGAAYSDGPFMLVGRTGATFDYAENGMNDVAAILVNQAHAHLVPQIAEAIRSVRPDVIVAPYSEAGKVAKTLNSTAPTNEQNTQGPAGTPPLEADSQVGQAQGPPEVVGTGDEGAAGGLPGDNQASQAYAPDPVMPQEAVAAAEEVAQQVKAAIDARGISGLEVVIDTESRLFMGGVSAVPGRITIHTKDLARETNGRTRQQVHDVLEATVIRHELRHIADYEVIERKRIESGTNEDYATFRSRYLQEMASEIPDSLWELAANIYNNARTGTVKVNGKSQQASTLWADLSDEQRAQTSWGRIASIENRMSELLRMMAEAASNPEQAALFTELFRETTFKAPTTLLGYMRAFVEAMIAKVKSLPVGSMARQHVEDAIEFYNGLLAPKQAAKAKQAAQQATPTPPAETPQAKAGPVPPSQENYSDSFGNTIDFLPDGQARWLAKDGTVLKEGPEQEVIDFAYRLDMVIGRAYGAAQRKYPALKDPKAAAELDDIADELEKVLADVPWRERTDFMTREFEAWAQDRLGQQDEQAAAADDTPDKDAAKEADRLKRREAQDRRVKRIVAKADEIIATTRWIMAMDANGMRIELPSNIISILQAKKERKETLSYKEAERLANGRGEDGIPRQSWYPGGGINEVLREIIRRITAKSGTGRTPDDISRGFDEIVGYPVTTEELLQGIQTELRGIAKRTWKTPAEFTEKEIQAAIAEDQAKRDKDFDRTNKETATTTEFPVDEFNEDWVGTVLLVGGEELTIESVEMGPDGKALAVVMQDGARFGRQEMESGEVLYAEIPAEPMEDDGFDPMFAARSSSPWSDFSGSKFSEILESGHTKSRSDYNTAKDTIQKLPRKVAYLGDVEVIRNPSDSDRKRMLSEIRSEFPMERGEPPTTRTTKDNFGNAWIWKAHLGMHSQIEPLIERAEGVAVDQNNGIPDHPQLIRDAIRSGKAIPESVQNEYPQYAEFFKQSNPLFSSQSSRQDAEYLAAVERGDMETAQRMVDEAAMATGHNVGPVYHGTKNTGFVTFTTNQEGRYFFAQSEEYAKQYAKGDFFADRDGKKPSVMRFFLMLRNPINLDDYMAGILPDSTGDTVDEWKSNGFDGAVSSEGGGTVQVFSPYQIKSADPVTRDAAGEVIPLSQRFNPASDSILYSSPSSRQSPFYSQLALVLEAKMPKAAPVGQVVQIARSNAKEDEVKWSGLVGAAERLAEENGGKVPKDKLLEWLAADGAVVLEEVVSGGNDRMTAPMSAERLRRALRADGFSATEADTVVQAASRKENAYLGRNSDISDLVQEVISDYRGLEENPTNTTRFSQYTLPGGQNYREVVLAMPSKEVFDPSKVRIERIRNSVTQGMAQIWYDGEKMGPAYGDSGDIKNDWMQPESVWMDHARKMFYEGDKYNRVKKTTSEYVSTHFPDVPNYVAHMRTNERTDAEGKPGLFVEEFQSDRHQAGRQKGYAADIDRWVEISRKYVDGATLGFASGLLESFGATPSEVAEVKAFEAVKDGAPADAPFRTSWPIQLFKRALRDAVAAGKEWIGFTTGRTQSDRFDLSKQIRELYHIKNDDGTYDVIAITLEGEQVVKERLNETQLEDFIGKEVGQKVVNGEGAQSPASKMKVLSGLDLKTESKGMIGFYDNMLPKEVQAYVKQWKAADGSRPQVRRDSVRIKDVMYGDTRYGPIALEMFNRMMSDLSDAEGKQVIREAQRRDEQAASTPIWRLDITDEMRKGVMEGQPLFASKSSSNQGFFDFGTESSFGTKGGQTGFDFGQSTGQKPPAGERKQVEAQPVAADKKEDIPAPEPTGDKERIRRSKWRELGSMVSIELPANASRFRPQPKDIAFAADKLGINNADAALAWNIFTNEDSKTPTRDAPAIGAPPVETPQPLPESLIGDPVEITEPSDTFTLEQAAAELAKRKLTVTKSQTNTGKTVWLVTGQTFDVKDALKDLGARWYNPEKAWSIYSNDDPTTKIANALAGKSAPGSQPENSGPDTGADDRANEDARLRELRQRLDGGADERRDRGDAIASVDTSTSELLRNGLKFGIPEEVVEGQIEDVASIVAAYENGKPAFILGNGAGTGKTFVLGGAIRELRAKGATSFVYVTMNQDLIEQIKRDLKSYGIGDVKFFTYSEMSTKEIPMPAGSVLIFDEAHNVKNADAARSSKAQPMMGRAKLTIFASATPFENPVQAAYLGGTGIFNQVGGHVEWGKAYGATVVRRKYYNPTLGREVIEESLRWQGGKLQDGIAARQWFVKQGIMVTRPMRLPLAMVDANFTKRPADAKWVQMYDQVTAAYDDAMAKYRNEDGSVRDARENSQVSMHMTNTIKRILEASKVNHAVEEAKKLLSETDANGNSNSVVIFVETKADRQIGRYRTSEGYQKQNGKDDTAHEYPEMANMMASWKRDQAVVKRMGGNAGPPPFAGFIVDIARAMYDARIQFELPSVEEQIVAALGGTSKVGVYTGSVTNAKARADKEAFLRGDKRVIVATMAKGGTGLSLHDTVGDRPTVQLNINLPWTASVVDQVSGRVARYGLQSKARINWLFADNIPFERMLAGKVGRRMRDMGALVKGIDMKAARVLNEEFDFDGTADIKQDTGEIESEVEDIYTQAERLERTRRKADDTSNGFFETPYPLAALMTEISGARGRVLEPSAGRGNLLRFTRDKKGVQSITAIEERGDNFQALQALFGNSITAKRGDFLIEKDGLTEFDTVLMNPPFERKAGVGWQDEAHIMAAFGMLAPGGRLVSIMGEGGFFRDGAQDKAFRQFLSDNGAIVVKLPENAFKNSGTGVRTRMVVLDQGAESGRTDIDLEDMDADTLRSVADSIPSREGVQLYASRSSRDTGPDLFAQANAPENAAKLSTVRVGTMSALGAYKALTAKRAAGKKLTADEEEKLLQAEKALGQKLAFDMEAVKNTAPRFDLVKQKVGDGVAYKIMVDGKMVGHLSGFEENYPKNWFHLSTTEISDEKYKGTGIYRDAVQQVANKYPGGLYVHDWESSVSLQKSLAKMPTRKIDGKRIIILPATETATQKPAAEFGTGSKAPKRPQGEIGGADLFGGQAQGYKATQDGQGMLFAAASSRHAELEAKHNAGTITPAETAEAQRLVDEAAKAAGYDVTGFHGTAGQIPDVFIPTNKGRNTSGLEDRPAVFFAVTDKDAAMFAEHASNITGKPATIFRAYLRTGKSVAKFSTSEAVEDLKSRGIDSTFLRDIESGRLLEYAVFDPSQIKSADPFTGVPLDQRFDAASDSILFASVSSGADPAYTAAAQMVMKSLPKDRRQIFEAAASGMPTAEIVAKFPVSEKGIANIIADVETRIAVAMQAASPGGLSPKMEDGKIVGSPKLAYSANPNVAAVDQARKAAGLPNGDTDAEIAAIGDARLEADYAGEYAKLQQKANTLDRMDKVEVYMAGQIIAKETLRGIPESHEDRIATALFINGYRELGSEASAEFRQRRDRFMTPAQRNARMIAEALFTPDENTRERLRKAKPGEADAILSPWIAKIDKIKAELQAKGIDLDTMLSEFAEYQAARYQAERENPEAKRAFETTFRKLGRLEKLVIRLMRDGADQDQILKGASIGEKEARDIVNRFDDDLAAAQIEFARRYVESSLGASATTDPLKLIRESLGIYRWEQLDSKKPDWVHPSKPHPKTKAKKKSATRPPLANPKISIDEWANRPPSTWRTLWETEMGQLQPQNRVTFEDWAAKKFPRTAKAWQESMDFGDTATAPAGMTIDEWAARQLQQWRTLYQGEMTGLQPNQRITFEEWAARKPSAHTLGVQAMLDLPDPNKKPVSDTTGTFDINDPVKMREIGATLGRAHGKGMDKFMEWWRASILSGPQTAVVNTVSNAAFNAYNLLPRRATEAMVNNILGLVGQGSDKSATFGEFAPMFRVLGKALRDSVSNAMQSWKLRERIFETYAGAESVDVEFDGTGAKKMPEHIGGPLGTFIRSISFRHMTAADEFMKTFYGNLEAAAQAHRIAAVEEKLKGAEYEKRLEELMKRGSKAWVRARDNAMVVTFQQKLDRKDPRFLANLDRLALLAKQGRSMPWIGRPLTFVLPFIDTPTNLFKQAIEMSPLGAFLAVIDGARALRIRYSSKDLSPELAKLEASRLYDRARLVKDLTNQTVALLALYAVQELIQPGDDDDDGLPNITGTQPFKTTARGERDNAFAVMPPMTIRVGKLQFSYARLDPFATTLASMVDWLKEVDRSGGVTANTFSEWAARFKDQAKEKTFLQGVANLFNAIEDPDRFAERISASILTGFVPNLVRQPVRESQDIRRDTSPQAGDGFLTTLAKSVGYSLAPSAAPPKLDIWGNPIPANRGELIGGTDGTDWLFRMADPTNATYAAKSDPIDLWIFHWNSTTEAKEDRIAIEPIDDKISIKTPGVKKAVTIPLTPEEHLEANRSVGQKAKAMLGTDWDWKKQTPEQAKRITDTFRELQTAERARIRAEKIAAGLPASAE